jgi:hypothetical protein
MPIVSAALSDCAIGERQRDVFRVSEADESGQASASRRCCSAENSLRCRPSSIDDEHAHWQRHTLVADLMAVIDLALAQRARDITRSRANADIRSGPAEDADGRHRLQRQLLDMDVVKAHLGEFGG